MVQTGVGFYHYVINEDDDSGFWKRLEEPRIEGDGSGKQTL